jgi:hypothetical protein
MSDGCGCGLKFSGGGRRRKTRRVRKARKAKRGTRKH